MNCVTIQDATLQSAMLKDMASSYQNGELHCRFKRAVVSGNPFVFPLNENYYVFLGYGPNDQSGPSNNNNDDT